MGRGFARELAEQFTRTMFFGRHGTSLPLETNGISIDPALKDAWGLPCMRVTYKDHPDDLKCGVIPGAQGPPRSRRPLGRGKAWPTRSGRRPSPCTSSAPVAWATIGGPPSWIAITARTTCPTCSSATAAAWSPRRGASRPRPSRRWRIGPASTSRASRSAGDMSVARSVLLRASRSKWLAEQMSRRSFAQRAVKKFMPGEDVSAALDACEILASERLGSVITQLGENLDVVR